MNVGIIFVGLILATIIISNIVVKKRVQKNNNDNPTSLKTRANFNEIGKVSKKPYIKAQRFNVGIMNEKKCSASNLCNSNIMKFTTLPYVNYGLKGNMNGCQCARHVLAP
tara:strand:+ start:61 stop:390 length:330 start_codon:yes stop_codon:yes gene_type:complete